MPPRSLHEQIDAALERNWAAKKITPASPASDAEFVRRVYLDLCGMIPSAAQTKEFLDDPSSDKHSRLVDRLLASPEHALALARVLDVMLIERRTHTVASYDVAKSAWRSYLAASVAENKPWDQLVRELLSSDGTDEPRAAAAKFFISRDAAPHQLTRDVGRLLLGVDLQCAQCHDDPRIEEYRQADYYGLYAFLSRTTFFRDAKANKSLIGETAVGDVTFTSVFTAKKDQTNPRLPGGEMLPDPMFEKGQEYVVKPSGTDRGVPKYSRRLQLAEQLPRESTRGFARNLANRLWGVLFTRCIVHPPDLNHAGNPPTQPELLDILERWLVENRYDVRSCLREMAVSRAYRLSSQSPDGVAAPADGEFAMRRLEPLTPEQMRWSVLQATGRVDLQLSRALMQLKQSAGEKFETESRSWTWRRGVYESLERSSEPIVAALAGLPGQADWQAPPTVDQALFLLNSSKFAALLKPDPGTTAGEAAKQTDSYGIAETLYLATLSRRPTAEEADEVGRVLSDATSPTERGAALQSLQWALVLSAEFRLNH